VTDSQVPTTSGDAGESPAAESSPPSGRGRGLRAARPISWSGQALIIAVSIAYIVVEWRYNLRLMQIVIDPELPRDAMDRFSTMGRVVGAFGLAWGLLRPFVSAFRGTLIQVALFGCIWLCMFFGLTAAFKIVIDHVEPERKRAAMAVFQYRGDLLSGAIIDSGFPIPSHEVLVGPVMMVDMAMLTYDERVVAEASAAMERRAEERAAELRETAAQQWTGYQRLHRAIDRMHRRHRDGARDVHRARDQELAAEQFRARMGGMEPIPELSRAEFIRSQLPQSSLRDAKEIVRALDEVVMTTPGGEAMRVRDVPHSMDRRTYDRWVEDRVDEISFMLAPAADRINQHPHANAVVAAVYLPPIAMSLSLLAVIVNLAALVVQAMTSVIACISDRWWKPFSLIVGTALPAMTVVAVSLIAGPSAYADFPRAESARESMVQRLGMVGRLWARAGAVQVAVNAHSDRPERLVSTTLESLERRVLSAVADPRDESFQTADVDPMAGP